MIKFKDVLFVVFVIGYKDDSYFLYMQVFDKEGKRKKRCYILYNVVVVVNGVLLFFFVNLGYFLR